MDDEVLGCGGAIARHVEEGDAVSVAIVANRAYGHRHVASSIRQEELCTLRAQKVLGYQKLQFLRLPDERLDQSLIDVIVPLEKVVQEARPEIVYLCHRGDLNQDHRAVFEAGVIACRPLARARPRRLICYEVASSTDQSPPMDGYHFAPNLYLPLSAKHLKKKTEALKCYQRELRSFPHPRSIEGIKTLASRRGSEVGLESAEAFMMVREISS